MTPKVAILIVAICIVYAAISAFGQVMSSDFIFLLFKRFLLFSITSKVDAK